MKEKVLKLTNAVYKLLEFFPESDPIKNRAKDKALEIMESFVSVYETNGWASLQREKAKAIILEDIDILLGYFWIAKSQGWLNSVNYLILSNNYENIKKSISLDADKLIVAQKSTQIAPEPVLDKNAGAGKNPDPISVKFSSRQNKIIEFLEKNKKAQVMDLQAMLKNITKRTIRRDLDELLRAGKIAREGEFNGIFYKIKGRT